MALQVRARYKPDMFRSGMEALVGGGAGDGSAGTVYLAVQAIQFDDGDIPAINSAVSGDPTTERFINVLLEDTVQLDIPALNAMTNPNRLAALQQALDGWATANSGLIAAMGKIVRTARRMNARAIQG